MGKVMVVVGSAKGIGLEFVRQLSAHDDNVVHAVDREMTAELEALSRDRKNVHCHVADTTEAGGRALKSAAAQVPHIDLLLCIAGTVASFDPLLERSEGTSSVTEELLRMFTINVVGTWQTVEAFQAALAEGAKVLLMSSAFASMATCDHTKAPTYAISKAGVNMMGRKLALELAPRHISVILMSPGAVKTAIGGPWANVEVEDSVSGMLRELAREGTNGQFLRWDGAGWPW